MHGQKEKVTVLLRLLVSGLKEKTKSPRRLRERLCLKGIVGSDRGGHWHSLLAFTHMHIPDTHAHK